MWDSVAIEVEIFENVRYSSRNCDMVATPALDAPIEMYRNADFDNDAVDVATTDTDWIILP